MPAILSRGSAAVRAWVTGTADAMYGAVTSFDHRNLWFGAGRAVAAFGALVVLLFTPIQALTVPVGAASGTRCDSIRSLSLLCIGGPGHAIELRRWLLIACFTLVVVGIWPRWTALLHVWAAFTLSASLTLPDGGEAIGAIIALLILPLALADDRRWVWSPSSQPMNAWLQPVAFTAGLALRVQVAFIYLDSGLSKLGVPDWKNGTAEYYILRDPMFGVSGPAARLAYWVSDHALGAAAMTWGGILIEIAIGLCLLASHRWRVVGWLLDVVLHLSIIATIGLVSFALVMMGSATMAANPARRRVTGSRPVPVPAPAVNREGASVGQ